MARVTTCLNRSVNPGGLLLALVFGVGILAAAEDSPQREPPRVDFVFPLAVGLPAEMNLTLFGALGTLPLHGWCDDPGVTLARGASNDVFRISVNTNASPGVRWLRFGNSVGVSAWQPFVLSDRLELTAAPGTNAPVVESVSWLPAAVNSRLLADGRTNHFLVATRTNQLLEVRLQGLSLDSPVAARLQIRDEHGVVLDSASTTNGTDPAVTAVMLTDTRWQVEVTALTNFPAASFDTNGAPFRLLLDAVDRPALITPAGTSILTPHPEMQRPNLTPRVTFPGLVHGFVSDPLEEDLYGFDALAGHVYGFRLKAGSLSSPLRGVVRILDAERNAITQSLPAADPELVWTAPGDGRYTIVVAAEPGSGGLDCLYQLELDLPRADLRALLAAHTLVIEPGKSASLDFRVVKPLTFDRLLVVTAQGLPPGVSAAPIHLLPEMDRATLTVTAAADLAPTNAPVQLVVMPATPPILVETARATVQGRYTPPGKLLRNEVGYFWVTITAPTAQ